MGVRDGGEGSVGFALSHRPASYFSHEVGASGQRCDLIVRISLLLPFTDCPAPFPSPPPGPSYEEGAARLQKLTEEGEQLRQQLAAARQQVQSTAEDTGRPNVDQEAVRKLEALQVGDDWGRGEIRAAEGS